MSIDDRKAAVLRAIVEEYVGSAQPVGSKTIAETRDLGVSAATIRNDMSVLEREGFITRPHTSAGRIPTDRGYRYFVDHFADSSHLPTGTRRQVADFFGSTARAMEDLLHDSSLLLARLTDHAAVVVGPGVDVGQVRSVQLVPLQPRLLLAIAVLSDGVVEKQPLVLPEGEDEPDDAELATASELLTAAWRGQALAEVRPVECGGAIAARTASLVQAAATAFAGRGDETGGEPVYVGGASRLAAEHAAFTSLASAARVLELLEQHVVMVAVLRELLGPGLTIRIGEENERDDLRECSLVLAPYLVEGEPVGTVGVLGPTRMDYRQASAAVSAVSAHLGRQLTK